ncbi:TOPRIM nucleotidyl transferase/hydrolase domain-containing protein [Rhizobium sp. CECT 9324]|jgi:hypothetical protein|uniref:TOPRIM nucleotidyl transferase/hydrolase domain-containing protein n=1 Tax=Rhizobium sp. CECT 9324 TaxID=2845820 RepID=UPI001E445C74|nr:TOPRIM nucleotidyl transferase/hydrolase domain-containing protein [Rhizobium sp. CECT 9324]CAH0341377.1 hypothetical protein RHI9324_03071 [Rhizobium sp. CECT 9324]
MIAMAGDGPEPVSTAPTVDSRPQDMDLFGYERGPDAPIRATARAIDAAAGARSVILVEGISDQIALETTALRLGLDLVSRRIVVVPVGGIASMSRYLSHFLASEAKPLISGLFDGAEAPLLLRAVQRADQAQWSNATDLRQLGFFLCDRDLEDELLRAVSRQAVEAILNEQGDQRAFQTLQRQDAWRDSPFHDQLRRFLAAGAGRKLRYARHLALAITADHTPAPLFNVLSRAASSVE